jgi:hypothetical protein
MSGRDGKFTSGAGGTALGSGGVGDTDAGSWAGVGSCAGAAAAGSSAAGGAGVGAALGSPFDSITTDESQQSLTTP